MLINRPATPAWVKFMGPDRLVCNGQNGQWLRELICRAVADVTSFAGEIEVDESYFGGRRKGKLGRGMASKVPGLSLLKNGVERSIRSS